MAKGFGMPTLPHPHGLPLGHPGVNGGPHLTPHHLLTSSASGVIGRPTSTPSTGTSAFNGKSTLLASKMFLASPRGHHTRNGLCFSVSSIIGGHAKSFLVVIPVMITYRGPTLALLVSL